jgi:hypothetical protein
LRVGPWRCNWVEDTSADIPIPVLVRRVVEARKVQAMGGPDAYSARMNPQNLSEKPLVVTDGVHDEKQSTSRKPSFWSRLCCW